MPVSLNLNEDLQDLFITTENNKLLKIALKSQKIKNDLEEGEHINVRRGNFSYCYFGEEETLNTEKVIAGNDLAFLLVTDAFGNLVLYKDIENLRTNCGIYLLGHTSKI